MQANFAQRVETAVHSLPLTAGGSPRPWASSWVPGSATSPKAWRGGKSPISRIAGYPQPTVEGHRGVLKLGRGCAVLSGRFHYYEGVSLDDVVLPVFLLHRLGVRDPDRHQRRGRHPPQLPPRGPGADPRPPQPDGRAPAARTQPAGVRPALPRHERGLLRGELRQASPRRPPRQCRGFPGGLAEGVYAAFPGPELRNAGGGAHGRASWARTWSACPRCRRSSPPTTWA